MEGVIVCSGLAITSRRTPSPKRVYEGHRQPSAGNLAERPVFRNEKHQPNGTLLPAVDDKSSLTYPHPKLRTSSVLCLGTRSGNPRRVIGMNLDLL